MTSLARKKPIWSASRWMPFSFSWPESAVGRMSTTFPMPSRRNSSVSMR